MAVDIERFNADWLAARSEKDVARLLTFYAADAAQQNAQPVRQCLHIERGGAGRGRRYADFALARALRLDHLAGAPLKLDFVDRPFLDDH